MDAISLLKNAKPVLPDPEKILYAYSLVKSQRCNSNLDPIQYLGMLASYVNKDMLHKNSINCTRLCLILTTLYGVDFYKLFSKKFKEE